MITVERILSLLQQSNVQQKELAAHLKITDKIVSAWRTGRSQSYTKYLPQIAEVLGITVDELLQGEENRLNKTETITLTKAMLEFSMRVLEGKECTLQETAILPDILLFLLVSQKSE